MFKVLEVCERPKKKSRSWAGKVAQEFLQTPGNTARVKCDRHGNQITKANVRNVYQQFYFASKKSGGKFGVSVCDGEIYLFKTGASK